MRSAALCLLLCGTSLLWVPARAAELVENPGFEAGVAPWRSVGAAVAGLDGTARSGTSSVLVHSRAAPDDGLQQSLPTSAAPGRTHALEAWVRVSGPKPHPISLSVWQVDDRGGVRHPIQSRLASDGEWLRLGGAFTLETVGALTELAVSVHGPPAGIPFQLDDVSVATLPAWEERARSGAERHRKRDVRVVVVDRLGRPVGGAAIAAEQTRHGFPLGSALADHLDVPAYVDFFVEHFEWATLENASKWHRNEPVQGSVSYASADSLVAFCAAHDIALRGHNLFWANEPPDWARDLTPSALQDAVDARLVDAVTHFEGDFAHWDVNNEMLHGDFFEAKLGPGTRVAMYQQVRALAPDTLLFVNDYSVVAGNETQDLVDQVVDLVDQGAPIDAIGAQSHFSGAVDPARVQSRLDTLAVPGLPIWITEFDVEDAEDASHADQLEAFYRAAFGHPAVDGILMWGFWAGDHWRGADAAIVNVDGTLRTSGERYLALRDEWKTLAVGDTDARGGFAFRGFHGVYDVRITGRFGDGSVHRVEVAPGVGEAVFHLRVGWVDVSPPWLAGLGLLLLFVLGMGVYTLMRRGRSAGRAQ